MTTKRSSPKRKASSLGLATSLASRRHLEAQNLHRKPLDFTSQAGKRDPPLWSPSWVRSGHLSVQEPRPPEVCHATHLWMINLGIEMILGVRGMASLVFDCFVKVRIWKPGAFCSLWIYFTCAVCDIAFCLIRQILWHVLM